MNEYVQSYVGKLIDYAKPILKVEHFDDICVCSVIDDSFKNRHSVGRSFNSFFPKYPLWIVTTDLELAKMIAVYLGAPFNVTEDQLIKIDQFYVSSRFQFVGRSTVIGGADYFVGESSEEIAKIIKDDLLLEIYKQIWI